MKSSFLVISLSFYAFSMFCFSHSIIPLSFSNTNIIRSFDYSDTNQVSIADVSLIDSFSNLGNHLKLNFYGIEIPLNINNHRGLIDTLDNNVIWRFKFINPQAKTINILFSNFHLTDSAKVFIYSPDGSCFLNPLTKKDISSTGHLSTFRIPCDTIIIELNVTLQEADSTFFKIFGIVYGVKEIENINEYMKENNEMLNTPSSNCDLDANCTQGDNFCREKYSVTFLLLKCYNKKKNGELLKCL